MAANYIDYIIADKILISEEHRKFYSEKIVYLPHSYMPTDSKREISNKVYLRSELGLPEEGFVFCCFNSIYKITPKAFDSFMRILQSVKGSVLWLLEDNPTSKINVEREAFKRGVAPRRIVFAKRLPYSDHLGRYRYADLFLDTLPYNAHSTASDALWAGLPILTRVGKSFSARVAASLLNAVGLPELITTSIEEYEQLAIKLATDPVKMQVLKQKLSNNRFSSKLFDTPLYAKHLEAAYIVMRDRYKGELEPDDIYIRDLSW
jgi:hypothetical protein